MNLGRYYAVQKLRLKLAVVVVGFGALVVRLIVRLSSHRAEFVAVVGVVAASCVYLRRLLKRVLLLQLLLVWYLRFVSYFGEQFE